MTDNIDIEATITILVDGETKYFGPDGPLLAVLHHGDSMRVGGADEIPLALEILAQRIVGLTADTPKQHPCATCNRSWPTPHQKGLCEKSHQEES